jgi:tetratricopeptide (TPR) repeat protein
VRAVESRLLEEERVQACHVLDFGLRAAHSWIHARDLTIALATYMERSGHWEIWQQFLERAIAAAQECHDIDHEITLTALLARLYQRWNKPKSMVQSYRRVIRLARRNGNRYELARACSNLGYHYILIGNLWRAELLSYHALAIFNELASNHGRAHTHNHLGILFTRQYDWVKAKEHLLMACAIWQTGQDQFGLMRGHGNLGFLYSETANYREAIDHSTLALKLAEMLGEEPLIGNFASNISFSQLKLGNVSIAKEFADLAETIFTKYADRSGLARVAHTKGLIAIHENNYLQAQDYINYALNTLEEYYLLIQVKFTKLDLEIRLHNYMVAKQELNEVESWINKHPVSNAMQFYADKLEESRRCLEQAIAYRIA